MINRNQNDPQATMPSYLGFLTLLTFPLPSFAIRHYYIINNCTLPINLYINSESQGPLASYGAEKTTRDFLDGWSGLIYNDFNQGNPDGAGTVRAGFYGTVSVCHLQTGIRGKLTFLSRIITITSSQTRTGSTSVWGSNQSIAYR
jgi:hypothetical protein